MIIPIIAPYIYNARYHVNPYILSTTVLSDHKWKNHFYEMKGDVGMSVHEKERKQEDAYTKTQTHS